MTVTVLRPTVESSHDAWRLAHQHPQGSEAALYWEGVARGMLAAEQPDSAWADQYRTDTGREWLAQPARLEHVATLAGMLPASGNKPRVYLISGLLWGFREATAHRDDAEECAGCSRRILTTVDAGWVECPVHGVVHEDCRNALCDRSHCYEAEFDDDAYFAAKYGDDS